MPGRKGHRRERVVSTMQGGSSWKGGHKKGAHECRETRRTPTQKTGLIGPIPTSERAPLGRREACSYSCVSDPRIHSGTAKAARSRLVGRARRGHGVSKLREPAQGDKSRKGKSRRRRETSPGKASPDATVEETPQTGGSYHTSQGLSARMVSTRASNSLAFAFRFDPFLRLRLRGRPSSGHS